MISTDLDNLIADADRLARAGRLTGDQWALFVRRMRSLAEDVAGIERLAVPAAARTTLTTTGGNVVPFRPRP